MPSAGEVCKLYRAFLREGRKFPNYNVREYVKRRAQEGFHQHAGESEAAAVQKLWEKAQSDLDLVRRQATVYTLFARKHKSIMDMPLQRVKDTV